MDLNKYVGKFFKLHVGDQVVTMKFEKRASDRHGQTLAGQTEKSVVMVNEYGVTGIYEPHMIERAIRDGRSGDIEYVSESDQNTLESIFTREDTSEHQTHVSIAKNGDSKRVHASRIYQEMNGKSRKEIIARFMSELNMSDAGASTYHSNFKSGRWSL